MADDITPPDPATLGSYWQQPDFEHEAAEDDSSISVVYKGDYDALSSFANTFTPGATTYEDNANFLLSTRRLERSAGPTGTLTLIYTDNAPSGDPSSSSANARRRSVAWRLSSCPADISIYRYCGPSSSNANRARIERWWADPGDDPASTIYELVDADQKIARKILEGKETVQRHYPMLVKTSVYTRGKITPTGKLDYYTETIADAPSWMVKRARQWLKVQEDCELAADKSQTLVEGWIGGESFDANFYGSGDSRWEFGSI